MTQMSEIARANALYRAGDYGKALQLYEDIALRSEWNHLLHTNIQLCRKRLHDHQGRADTPPNDFPIVVTMTTIRSRLVYVPKVIESVINQTLKPIRVDINISKQPYLIDEGIAPDDPILAELIKNPLVKINWVDNIGPYRKIWPFLENHFSKTEAKDCLFVTIDDDTLYPDYFLKKLYESYLLHDCVIAFRGRYIESDTKDLMPYEEWALGKNKPSLNNFPTGKDGVLYNTKFFTREFLNLKDALQFTPTADDIWIKWHLTLNGVPSVILNPEASTSDYKSFPVVNYDKSYRGNSLYAIYNSTASEGKNDKAIKQLEAFYMQAYGYNVARLIETEHRVNQYQRVLDFPKDALGFGICIKVDDIFEASVIGKLEECLRILHVRFEPHIVLGIGGLSEEGNKIFRKWLAAGIVDEVICSGHDSLVLNDLVDAAIRSNTASVVFMRADELRHALARALKFIVENRGGTDQSSLSADAGLWSVGQQKLRNIPKSCYPSEWNEGLQFAHAACYQELNTEKRSSVSVSGTGESVASHHLFVTEAGLERLGGWEKFKTLPIRLGGLSIDEFGSVSVLTVEHNLSDNKRPTPWKKVSAISKSDKNNESVVFDIWPAPYLFAEIGSQHDGATTINVPRQVLVGRRCSSLLRVSNNNDLQAVFIMSNFNKATYLHAALYGWVMQMHPRIRLEIVDDISTDDSVKKIHEFIRLSGFNNDLLSIEINQVKRGTYWIRNLVISRNLRDDVVFFINDSDDVSSALRTTMQLAELFTDKNRKACLFNIVRVDGSYAPLPLNNEVERYGTASLCFKSSLIVEVGYFQNIKKNADTEFIRRVKRFIGASALPWIKQPVMFQPFDGSNLTSDIYKITQNTNSISENLDSRKLHIEISDRHHEKLTLKDLPFTFGFPNFIFPPDYAQLGKDFLINAK